MSEFQRARPSLSLFARLSVANTALVLGMAASVAWFTYSSVERVVLPRELESVRLRMLSRVEELPRTTEEMTRVLGALSDHPALREIVAREAEPRGTAASAPARISDPRLADAYRELTRAFRFQIETQPEMLQIRLIGAGDAGREQIRLERARAGGPIQEVPPDRLQRKGQRDYMRAVGRLEAGEFYVSPIDLNQEFGRIVEPHVPVVRIATPVFRPNGARFGALIVNLDLGPTLERLRASSPPSSEVFALSDSGSFILHPDPRYEFAEASQDAAPELAELEAALESWPPDEASFAAIENGRAVTASRIRLSPENSILLIERRPLSTVEAAASIRRSALAIALAAVAATVAIALLLARAIASPLHQLAQAIGRYPRQGLSPLPIDAPGEIGALARAFDAMARDQAEKAVALEASMRRDRLHAAVFSSSHDAIVATDLDGRITAWNPSASQLYRIEASEAIGTTLASVVPENAELLELWEAIRRDEQTPEIETELRFADAASVEISANGSPVIDAAGEISGVAITARDLSAARRVERQVAQVFEASPHGMGLVTADGRIRIANRRLASLFGYEAEDLADVPVDTLVPERSRKVHAELRTHYAERPRVRPMGVGRHLFGLRRDGSEIPVEVALGPFESADGRSMVVVSVVDIRERQGLAENAMADRISRLEQSNADLREFARVVSHDLKAPVRGIKLVSSWILEDLEGKLDTETESNLQLLRSRVERLMRLIEGILVYSSVDRSDVQPRELDSRIVVDELLASLETPAHLEVRISGDWPHVHWDETQLAQVLQNLIQNAIQHHGKPRGRIELHCERADDCTWIHVEDDGIGIPDHQRTRVVQLFETLRPKDESQSTGIGLSIVKRIVERNRGELRITDSTSGGTDVSFSIPAELVRWPNRDPKAP